MSSINRMCGKGKSNLNVRFRWLTYMEAEPWSASVTDTCARFRWWLLASQESLLVAAFISPRAFQFVFSLSKINMISPITYRHGRKNLGLSAPGFVEASFKHTTEWRYQSTLHVLGAKYQLASNFSTGMMPC